MSKIPGKTSKTTLMLPSPVRVNSAVIYSAYRNSISEELLKKNYFNLSYFRLLISIQHVTRTRHQFSVDTRRKTEFKRDRA